MSTSFGECERARRSISAGLDGELSEFENVVLEGHLSACKACTAFLIETQSLTNELRNAPLERFEARVTPRRRSRMTLRFSPVAASLAVFAVGIGSILASVRVGPLVGNNTRRPPVISGNFGAAPLSGMDRNEAPRHSGGARQARQPHGPASRL